MLFTYQKYILVNNMLSWPPQLDYTLLILTTFHGLSWVIICGRVRHSQLSAHSLDNVSTCIPEWLPPFTVSRVHKNGRLEEEWVTMETGQNLPPVLNFVTLTAHAFQALLGRALGYESAWYPQFLESV